MASVLARRARKALRYGPQSLRGDAGERAAAAMQRMGLVSTTVDSGPPPRTKGATAPPSSDADGPTTPLAGRLPITLPHATDRCRVHSRPIPR